MGLFLMQPKILLLTVVLVSLNQINCTISEDTHCSEILLGYTLCQCSFKQTEYKINCPNSATDLQISVPAKTNSNHPLRFNCNGAGADVYKFFPVMNIGSISDVRLKSCPVPTEPISNLFDHLGIRDVTSIEFEITDLSVNLISNVAELPPGIFAGLKELEILKLNLNAIEFSPNTFAGLEELKTLELNLNVTKLPPNTFAGLKRLEVLKLKSNITELQLHTFDGLEELKTLELNVNVTELQPNTFAGLKRLKVLKLKSNITELQLHTFDGLEELKTLELNLNVTELQPNTFAGLKRLKVLKLKSNITELPLHAYDGLEGLISLELYLNFFQLPPNTFAGLKRLEVLKLNLNVTELQPNTLAGLKRLKVLKLKSNGTELPLHTFDGLEGLISLELYLNFIQLAPNTFAGLKRLKVLKLKSNITELQLHTFDGLEELKTLELNLNVTELQPNTFAGLKRLKVLKLKSNITELPLHTFDGLEGLISLELYLNFIQLPPNTFAGLKRLEVLKLKSNVTELQPNTFAGLKRLEVLKLNLNVTELQPNTFAGLKRLKVLKLKSNVTELPLHTFNGLEGLISLELYLNFIQLQPNTFAGLKRLEVLKLKSNITELPLHTFDGLEELLKLKLNLNVTELPPNTFAGLKRLEVLKLRSNITELPLHTFDGLEELLKLKLNLNVTELPPNTFAGLKRLEVLKLKSNAIELPTGIFSNQRKMKNLYLNLWNAQIRKINKEVFEGAISLETLEFVTKNSEILQSDVFSLLTNLRELKLRISDNHFQELPSDLLTDNKKLSEVKLTYNSEPFGILPPALFANLPHIDNIDVMYNIGQSYYDRSSELALPYNFPGSVVRMCCRINSIPGDLFYNSSLIGRMVLSNNELDTLPTALFSDQYDLHHLDLSFNKLKSLPDNLLSNTTQLRVLKISHNLLTEITREFFSSLINLKELHLNNNRLKIINSNAFSQTKNLVFLNMANNHINFGDLNEKTDNFLNNENFSPFHFLHQLETLNLRNNSLKFIYEDWYDTAKNLTKLDLGINFISSLDISKFTSNISPSIMKSYSFNNLTIELNHNTIRTINFTNIEKFKIIQHKISINLNDNPFDCDCRLLQFVQYLQGEQQGRFNFITNRLVCEEPVNLAAVNMRHVQPKALICSIGTENCPLGCDCWERSYNSALIVNCSNFKLAEITTFPQVKLLKYSKAIQIHIEDSDLPMLPTISVPGYTDVTHIYAARNRLSHIDIDNLPPNLTYLDLSHNNFKRINTDVLNFLKGSNLLQEIILSGNSWTCDCDAVPFMEFVHRRHEIITDVHGIYCANLENSTKFIDLTHNVICRNEHLVPIAWLVGISLSLCVLTVLTVVLYYKFRTEIKVLLYKHRMCSCLFNEEDLDKDKKYDAFVSYSHKDMQFVGEHLVPELENESMGFKLCVDVRDFIVGEYIPDQIINAIDNSRRTIVVLSENFIESVWARQEFRLAHHAALNEGRIRVVVIIYGDIGNTDLLDIDLKAYLKMNIYLKWGDPLFWDKLHYAMPHRTQQTAS